MSKVGIAENITSIVNVCNSINIENKSSKYKFQTLIDQLPKDITKHEVEKVERFLESYSDYFSTGVFSSRLIRIQKESCKEKFLMRKEADRIITSMADDDIIEPSESPWYAPVVIVRKKDGSTIFCVD